MTHATASARFDDMLAGTGIVFTGVHRTLVARRPDEVAEVLETVERLTDAGAWAFGFVAYEAASGLDPTLQTRAPMPGLPLAWFGICDAPTMVDAVGPHPSPAAAPGQWKPRWDDNRYQAAVWAIRQRIAAGDTYQCNITTRLTTSDPQDAYALYSHLAHAQRGAHHAFIDLGELAIASASPELFFELSNNDILMRPMKGTAARGRTDDEDAAAVRTLSSNSKERAENIMIVDLIRNDMAAIAEVGSVQVTALCRPERYETVHQLTSDVRARLRPDCGLVEIFRALFPCGSVTGAPKRSTMQIIADLEDEPRGVYCGAIGIVAPPHEAMRARFSVAIRTVVVDRARGIATYGTGGGVTWASDPAAEHAEAMTKAAILRTNTADFQLVEFIRWERGRGPVRLEAHLARLARSAHYFGFGYHPESVYAAITSEMRDRVPDSEAARIRLTLSRDGQLDVSVGPCPEPAHDPVSLAIDYEPLDSRECWPYHKTTRRQPYERRLARHRADDVVLVNERGEVTGSCTANLAALISGRWWTPPVDSGCIAGVGRAVLVESQFLSERTLTPADLLEASSLALISSVRGWQQAVLLVDEMRQLA